MGEQWLPLIVAAFGIVGAVVTDAYQRRVDRRTALIELCRDAYTNYLNAFMAMSDNPPQFDELRRRYYQAEVKLLIVGSDRVIQDVGALSRYFSTTNPDRSSRDASEIRRLVAEVCRSMRADCFEKSDLTNKEIQAVVPIV
jgi:hypothetical protein